MIHKCMDYERYVGIYMGWVCLALKRRGLGPFWMRCDLLKAREKRVIMGSIDLDYDL